MNKPHGHPILTVSSLSKNYKHVKAVQNISFSIDQGDIFAFLGPNGAGKTTTLRILLDIIKPESGQIKWNLNGLLNSLPSAENIGYLPEERGLYPEIPIIKSLVYLASIRGMEPSKAKIEAYKWLEKLELADRAKEKLQALSKGNQQKIQFIASILHKPGFVILDEPFSGLDPLNQEKFIEYIKEINKEGTTVLLSAHQMSLIEKIANKVFLINGGQEIYNGTLSGIYNAFGENNIIDLTFKSVVNENMFQILTGVESVTRIDDYNIKLTFGYKTELKTVLSELSAFEELSNITSHKAGLHEIFLQLVKTSKK
jgi:ABC-2 type transport system ATP-binding protein